MTRRPPPPCSTPAHAQPARAWWRDPGFYLVLALGVIGLALPRPSGTFGTGEPMPAVWLLAVKAFAEELFFRAALQQTLNGWFARRGVGGLGPLSPGNLAVSTLFALAHLFVLAPPLALATFLPSLALGWLWDRHRSLAACTLVHLVYNLCALIDVGWM